MTNVTKRRYSFLAVAERGVVRDVKEELRYVGVDYDIEPRSTAETEKEKTYVLPDRNIFIGAVCFYCAAVFFQPNSTCTEANGIHGTRFPSIMKRDFDIRKVFVRSMKTERTMEQMKNMKRRDGRIHF